MLKVLQLIPTLDQAGAEKQMVLLAKGLPRDRFHVEVAALTRLGPYEASLKAANIPVTCFGKRLKLDLVGLIQLERFLEARRFDVVNTWIFAANTYGRIASHLAKVPVTVTSEMAVDLWKSRAQLRLDRWLAHWCDRIVGNSQAVVDFYRNQGIPENKLTLIYSGIGDVETPRDTSSVRAELGLVHESPVLLFAGRLAQQKGVRGLIDALDLLQHVEPSVVTLIAGDGPLRAALESRASTFELLATGRVRFLGQRDDVPRLLCAADILVLPSQYEGLPNVVLEAMRFGKPVVATAAPGTTELVIDGETGLLVPIGRPLELCKALRILARDPELRQRLGDAGRVRVQNHFHVSSMIDRYAELYEELVRFRAVGHGGAQPTVAIRMVDQLPCPLDRS